MFVDHLRLSDSDLDNGKQYLVLISLLKINYLRNQVNQEFYRLLLSYTFVKFSSKLAQQTGC